MINFLIERDYTKITPSTVRVYVGQSVELSCSSFNGVIWFHEDTKFEPIHKSDPLYIDNVTLKDHGEYYCYGEYSRKKHFLAKATVIVLGKPSSVLFR